MSFMFFAGILAIGTFLLCLVRPGRFGQVVLALGAGYVLASLWADRLADYQLLRLSFVSWGDAVYLGLVLLPGIFVLLFSHKQKSVMPRMVAALAVALLVVALTLPLFSAESQSRIVYDFINQYRDVIIATLLVVGLLDMAFARSPKAPKSSKD